MFGSSVGSYGVQGTSTTGTAVFGLTGEGTAVMGQNVSGIGVMGTSSSAAGVSGTSNYGSGVYGQSGASGSAKTGSSGIMVAGVSGQNTSSESTGGYGVWGGSATGDGVHGDSSSNQNSGVAGANSAGGAGVWGSSKSGDAIFGMGGKNGVHGETASPTDSGVWGNNTSPGGLVPQGYGVSGTSTNGVGVYGEGKFLAAYFNGNVNTIGNVAVVGNVSATGDLSLSKGNITLAAGNITLTAGDIFLASQDCAEDFDVSEVDEHEPGAVMIVNENGILHECSEAYDKRVVGVVSGAGNNKPALVLGRRQTRSPRAAIALIGKVYCKVDADYSPIKVGDLLTTSNTLGHAMKVRNSDRALGAVIGKAMKPLEKGRDLIPILIALQ